MNTRISIGKKIFLFEDLIVMLPEIYLNYGDIHAPHTEVLKRHAARASDNNSSDRENTQLATNICLFHNYSKLVYFEARWFTRDDIEDCNLDEISKLKGVFTARAYTYDLNPSDKIVIKHKDALFIRKNHYPEVKLFTKVVCQK